MLESIEIQHELRTPLAAILGMVSFLKKGPLTSEQQHYTDCILESVQALLRLAENFQTRMPSLDIKTLITPKKRLRVLLVEDHHLLQIIHRRMLRELGCEVDIAVNASEALSLVNNHYDLICLDINLPDMNGIEVAKALRQHKNHIHTSVIAITAHTDNNTEQECYSAGIEQIIHKPVDSKILAFLIKHITLTSNKGERRMSNAPID